MTDFCKVRKNQYAICPFRLLLSTPAPKRINITRNYLGNTQLLLTTLPLTTPCRRKLSTHGFCCLATRPTPKPQKYPLSSSLLLIPPTLQNCPRISPPSCQVSLKPRKRPSKKRATRTRKNHPSFNAERNYPRQESRNPRDPLERGEARKPKNPTQKILGTRGGIIQNPGKEERREKPREEEGKSRRKNVFRSGEAINNPPGFAPYSPYRR